MLCKTAGNTSKTAGNTSGPGPRLGFPESSGAPGFSPVRSKVAGRFRLRRTRVTHRTRPANERLPPEPVKFNREHSDPRTDRLVTRRLRGCPDHLHATRNFPIPRPDPPVGTDRRLEARERYPSPVVRANPSCRIPDYFALVSARCMAPLPPGPENDAAANASGVVRPLPSALGTLLVGDFAAACEVTIGGEQPSSARAQPMSAPRWARGCGVEPQFRAQ